MKLGWDHTVTPKEENLGNSKSTHAVTTRSIRDSSGPTGGLFTDNMEVSTFRDRMERFYRFLDFGKSYLHLPFGLQEYLPILNGNLLSFMR